MNVKLTEKCSTHRRAPSQGGERGPLGMTAAGSLPPPALPVALPLTSPRCSLRVIFLKPRVSNFPLLKTLCRCSLSFEHRPHRARISPTYLCSHPASRTPLVPPRQLMTSHCPDEPHRAMDLPSARIVSPPSPLPPRLSPSEAPRYPSSPSTGLSSRCFPEHLRATISSWPSLHYCFLLPVCGRISPADHEWAKGRHCQQGPLGHLPVHCRRLIVGASIY